ncbi:MAG: hypothetical protein IPN86_13890 [Saprospiraceae bacterium]|nr:hypothetical protein [Saprospiraceae bacterium]
MVSLRMIHIQKKTDIQVREYLDYVDILYGKGLYIQSLKILDKAKALAEKSNNDLLSLAILETEKNIESRHITRSGTDMVPDLIEKSVAKIKTIEGVTKLSISVFFSIVITSKMATSKSGRTRCLYHRICLGT